MVSKQKIKKYHIIILSLLLSSLLILNSNHINKHRTKKIINEDKNSYFEGVIINRKLEEIELQEKTGTEKVCEKGSQELKDYYEMGSIGLKEDEGIKYDDKNSKYMKALKLILKKIVGDSDDGEEEDRIRRLEFSLDSETKTAIFDYAIHFLPIIIFLVVGILAIPAWPICCVCCCCNCCCCCCCCKKNPKKSKNPCFFFTYVLYALVIGVCVYGLFTTNKVFVDISDTECSILKFFDEVKEGEKNKIKKPIWSGFSEIQVMINELSETLTDLKANSLPDLNQKIEDHFNDRYSNKGNFIGALEVAHEKFFNPSDSDYLNIYSYTSTSSIEYVLDIIKKFGKYNSISRNGEPIFSTIFNWTTEFSFISEQADNQLTDSKNDLNKVLGTSFDTVIDNLNEGSSKIDDFSDKFDNFKEKIADKILKYSDDIDKYGKLVLKLFFGVLGLTNIFIAFFMLLVYLFSGKMCTNCCCCRCFFKFFVHLLWNILYLLMILTFFIGFILSAIGQIGKDAMNIISFIVSDDNLGENGENLIFNKYSKVKNYVNICINKDGDIKDELGIEDQISENLNRIYSAQILIDELNEKFKENLEMYTYNNATIKFNDIYNDLTSTEKFGLLKKSNENMLSEADLQFQEILNEINQASSADNNGFNPWSGSCTLTSCIADRDCNNPKECNVKDTVSSSLQEKAEIIDKIRKGYDHAKDASIADGGYITTLDNLKNLYGNFLGEYTGILDYVSGILHRITDIIEEKIGKDGEFFDIINCKFIGKNLKVLLKNLKSAIGEDVKTLGIVIFVAAYSLALSISSTILLIIIINLSIDKNKQFGKEGEIPEYPSSKKNS